MTWTVKWQFIYHSKTAGISGGSHSSIDTFIENYRKQLKPYSVLLFDSSIVLMSIKMTKLPVSYIFAQSLQFWFDSSWVMKVTITPRISKMLNEVPISKLNPALINLINLLHAYTHNWILSEKICPTLIHYIHCRVLILFQRNVTSLN